MFGEDLLIGHKEVRIDEKNRIFLPSFTKATGNDNLALINGVDTVGNPQVKLYLFNRYREILERFQELQQHATTQEEYLRYEKEIADICSKIYSILKVDKQRRILIPEDLMVQNSWTERNSLLCEGKGNYITLK